MEAKTEENMREKAPIIPLKHPEAPKKGSSKRAWFARGLLAAALAGGAVGVSQIAFGEHNSPVGESTPTPAASASLPPESPMPTKSPEPTASPTPEAPKFVYWTKEQIEKAEQDALLRNKIIYADTWSELNGNVQNANTYNDHTILVIDRLTEGQTFESPTDGIIDSVPIGKGRTFEIYSIQVKLNNNIVSYYFSIDSKPLVEPGQKIAIGTPLVKLSGESIPKGMLFSKPGQIAIANETSFSTTTQDLLTDSNGLTVRLQPAPR